MAGDWSRNLNFDKVPGANQFQLQRHQPQGRSPVFYAALPDRIRSIPMSVPHARESPPPPLPPPRWIEEISDGADPGWEFANRAGRRASDRNGSASIKPGSSLLGGQQSRSSKSYTGPERKIDLERPAQVTSLSTSLGSEGSDGEMRIPDLRDILEYNKRQSEKLKSEKQMGEKTLERSSQAYDKQLLSRIGGSRTPTAPAAQGRPGDAPSPRNDESSSSAQSPYNKGKGQIRPLAMPERRHSDMDARSWTAAGANASVPGSATPPSALALSPRFSGLRSPISEIGLQRTLSHPAAFSTMKQEGSGDVPGRLIHRDSYDHSLFSDQDYATRSPAMQQMMIASDRSPGGSDDYQQNSKTGDKRRATSPPSDSVIDPRLPGDIGVGRDAWQRPHPHQAAGRNNQQTPRFHTPTSLSSAASSAPQNASFPSSYGLSNPSTSTSYQSDRLSPITYAAADPSHTTLPVHPLGRIDPNNAPPIPIPHRRTESSNVPRAPGLWICDCCPKKPKKFESEDELRIHEMEKQYICQYCHNRFKNKNEAERHQNSLHLRRHSWSCAALTSFEAAFHPTPSNSVIASIQGPNAPYNPNNLGGSLGHDPAAYPGALHSTPTDTCGYCGNEFLNPPNWDERVEHLNHIHKFGECNQSKKFFRADHFRQHLKHSHAGSSGKWTNMLENACMKDEPPPQPLDQQTLPPGMPGITMVGQQQLIQAAAAAAAAQQGTQQRMSNYPSPTQTHMSAPGMIGMGQMQQQQLSPQQEQHQQQQAGQRAMRNATGPMSGGGPLPPMMHQQQQHIRSPNDQQQQQHAQQQAQQAMQQQ